MSENKPAQRKVLSSASGQSEASLRARHDRGLEISQHVHQLNEAMLDALGGLFRCLDCRDERGFCAALPKYLKMSFANVDHRAPPSFDELCDWNDARMLFAACSQGLPRAVESLLRAGARAFDEAENAPPLFAAALSRSTGARECVEILLANGATVFQAPTTGESALHLAASVGHADLCIFLLERGADYRFANAIGQTPWSCAIGFGQLDAAAAICSWVEAQELAATLPCAPSAPAPPARRI